MPGMPSASLLEPLTQRPTGAFRLLAHAASAKEGGRRRVPIVVRVKPCAGHAGRRVLLNRGGRRLAAKRLNGRCVARFFPRVGRRSTFRAVLPATQATNMVKSQRLVIHAKGG